MGVRPCAGIIDDNVVLLRDHVKLIEVYHRYVVVRTDVGTFNRDEVDRY